MPTLSLCLITRDEEQMLPGCLASVKGVVDEIVLVDTGSSDRTREIAAASGARIFDLPWDDDFSAPRNEAARQARGDWLLQLDADERLAAGAGTELLRAIRRGRFDVGLLPLHNASAFDAPSQEVLAGRARIGNPMTRPRLIRNAGAPRYGGIVHESVEEWFYAAPRKARFVEAPIIHLGYVASLVAARDKHQRNLALLRRRCQEVPDDAFALGYLAAELLVNGDLDGAWAAAEAGWAVVETRPSSRFVHRLAVCRARLAIGRGEPEVAIATLRIAVAHRGEQFDFAYWAGRAWDSISQREAHRTGRARAASTAADVYQRAITLLPLRASEKLTDIGIPQLQVVRGHALLVAERLDEAQAAFGSALRADPISAESRLGLAELSLQRGRLVDALKELESLLSARRSSPDAWLLAAEAAHALGAHEDAKGFLARTVELRRSGAFAAPHRELRFRVLTDSAAGVPAGGSTVGATSTTGEDLQ